MEFGDFLRFIYFNSLAISMNLLDQIVTVNCNLVLKTELSLGLDRCSLLFSAQLKKNVIVRNLEFI